MNPEQPVSTPPQVTAVEPVKKRSIRLPIILMVWPTVGIILSIVLYAVVNLIASSAAPAAPVDGELFAQQNPLQTTANVLLFLVGGLSVALGPISFIAGLVLLIIRLQKK